MCITSRHLGVICPKYLFYEHRAIGEPSMFAVILARAGRGRGEVHLVSLRIEHCIRSKRLVMVAIVIWLPNISRFVYQCKAVETLSALGFGCLEVSEDGERKHGK